MKGNTQFPQLPLFEEGDDVDTGDGDGVGEGVGVAGGKVAPPAYGGQVERSGISWFSQSVKWETSE